MTLRERVALWLARRLGVLPGAVRDDAPAFVPLTGRPQDYDSAQTYRQYQDALTAWRKNPIAWRIINITTDFVVGDRIVISSPVKRLERFVRAFWDHPQNMMDLRLAAMSDELARAGDVFVVLFRNPHDGMSYLRFVTKDEIVRIEVADNDWERELVYHQRLPNTMETKRWLSPAHPGASAADAVMLHYSVNRPVGAILGEGDLTTILPWLQRYSQMLEDRVRLHWAAKVFLMLVTVPSNRVAEKRNQYASPPESGSIIIKDESEKWEMMAPNLQAVDAAQDLRAVRMMIDAGSGYPAHWRGEAADANLATATAMQGPTERHLARRQLYFVYMLQDIVWTAWRRAAEVMGYRALGTEVMSELFQAEMADISRADNEALARAARNLAQAIYSLIAAPNRSKTLNSLLLRLVFRFAGEPQDAATIAAIVDELWETPLPEGDMADAGMTEGEEISDA